MAINIDLSKYVYHQNNNKFINKIFTYVYYPLINLHTRIISPSCSLIDNINTNDVNVSMKNGILINDISDHLPVFMLIEY